MGKYQSIVVIAFLIYLSLFPGNSMAGAWSWLEASPVSHFTPEDKQIMRKTARDALDSGKDGIEIAWKNPQTGHSGSVMPISKIRRDDLACRKTKFTNHAEGLTSIQLHLLCKQADGTWKIFK
jgi:surface antigen